MANQIQSERNPVPSFSEWLQERYDNCHRIAAEKTDLADKTGWLIDAAYFRSALDIAEERSLLIEAQKYLKQRCLHDFVLFLLNSVKDTLPTDDPREVLRIAAMAANETGIADLGEGECSCKQPDCPYLLARVQGGVM